MARRPSILSARLLACLAAIFAGAAAPAAASDLLSLETISGVADVRIVAANGERSWTDEGFGKARFGGQSDQDWKLRPVAAEGTLVWQPRFSWSLKGTVVVAAQHEQEHPLDLVEAFVTFKPLPRGGTRFSARAGLFWPEISLEHEGAAWTVADMITPSAINSWIGEEVKIVGAEAGLSQDIGPHRLSGTLGIFGFNDTAGTLLSFRGWALHDLKATAFGRQQLPELSEFMEYGQAHKTRPLIEIDDKPGFYARLGWTTGPVALSAFYYRNRGDPEAVTPTMQWGWDTRFWNLGARIDLSEDTKIIAQAMTGTTEMGPEKEEEYWVDTRFRSAFLRVSHSLGAVSLSGRYDWFDTRERGYRMEPEESEEGWAVTAAARWNISSNISVLGEVLHIESDRGTRARLSVDPEQRQTVVQAALRLTF